MTMALKLGGGGGAVLATHDCVVDFALHGTLGAKSVMAVVPAQVGHF